MRLKETAIVAVQGDEVLESLETFVNPHCSGSGLTNIQIARPEPVIGAIDRPPNAFSIGTYGLATNSGDALNLVLDSSRLERFVCRCGFKTFNPVSLGY